MPNVKKLIDVLKICNVLPIFIALPAFATAHTEDLVVNSTDKKFEIGTGGTERYLGNLSGDGIVYVRPGNKVDNGSRPDTTAVFEGSIAGFTGEFRTTQWSNGSFPNARGNIVLKNWADGQTVKLQGSDGNNKGNSGTIVFDGKNKVKLLAQRDSGAVASIYLTGGATLDNTSDVDHSLFFGADRVDVDSVELNLLGYQFMDGAVMHAGGANNNVAGDVVTTVSKSAFSEISGNGTNTNVGGSIKLKVEDVTAKNVFGNLFSDKSLVKGDIFVDVLDADVSNTVSGLSLNWPKASFVPQYAMGVEGTIFVNVKDSVVVKSVRGANSSAGYAAKMLAEKLLLKDIVINVENTVVGEEIIGLGSNLSTKGDITVNMKGANAVGYADLDAITELDGDITVRVGAKRADTTVEGDTTLNIDTYGSNKVWVNGILNPGNESNAGYVLGDATLNMMNTIDGRGEIFAKTIETFNVQGNSVVNISNVDVNVSENIAAAFDEINIGEGAVLTVKDLAMKEGAVLNMTMTDTEHYGKLVVTGDATVSGAGLNLLVGSVGNYQDILAGLEFDDFAFVSAGTLFDVVHIGDDITVTIKPVEDLVVNTGLTTNAAAVVAGLANTADEKLNELSILVQEKLLTGDEEDKKVIESIATVINPEKASVVQSTVVSVQNTVSSLASNRMSMPAMGRNGGDVNLTSGAVWAQGLFNKSKMNNQFDARTRGVAAGIDGTFNKVAMFGIGYALNRSDIELNLRDTQIDSHSLFLYGQYKPNKWYVNAGLNYTLSDYTETGEAVGVAVVSEYKTDAFGAQLMTGYDFNSGVTPELGLRYLHVNSETYLNSLGIENQFNAADYLTSTVGLKYVFDVVASDSVLFRPELHYAFKYDLISDKSSATVAMPGGASYTINGDRLSRIGSELGIGLTMKYKGLDLSLSYDLEVRQDYTSQTGMFKFRTQF